MFNNDGKSIEESIKHTFMSFKNEIGILNNEYQVYQEKLNHYHKLFLSKKTIPEKRYICIKELKGFEIQVLRDLLIDFECKLNKSKQSQIMTAENFGSLFLLILLLFIGAAFDRDALNQLINLEFYNNFLGASGIAVFILALWKLAFSLETLPIKIYEESIYLLKKVINQYPTFIQIPIEDYGLAKLMEEAENDEVLSKSEALAYLEILKKDALDS